MSELRTPFFVVAVVLVALAVLVEVGSSLVVGGGTRVSDLQGQAEELGVDVSAGEVAEPPGRGITHLALVDAVLLYTVLLMGASLIVPERLHGRVQGVLTLVASIVLVVVALVLAVVALVELLVMVALFSAVPFGTIAYLALWGFFPRGDAATLLSLLLFLKLGFAAFLVLAQQRFLQQKGLVLLVLTSLLCTLLVFFLHGLVPIVLVSILDNVAALIVAIVAIVWGVVLLVGSIPGIVSALRAGAPGA